MSKRHFVAFCILHLAIFQCAAFDGQKIKFVSDFLLGQTVFLNALTCRDRGIESSLVKTLSKIGIATSVRRNCDLIDTDNDRNVFLVDMSCPFVDTCLKKASFLNLFLGPYKWIMFDNEHVDLADSGEKSDGNVEMGRHIVPATMGRHEKSFAERWTRHLNGCKVLSDSEMVVVTQNEDKNGLNMTYVYKRRIDQAIITEEYGYWHNDIGIIDVRSNPVVSMRRLNLHKNHLTASLVISNDRTRELLSDYRFKHIDTLSRTNYHMTCHLMDFMNATKNFSFVKTWGYISKNGTVNGMIGEMADGTADLGGTPLFLSKERMDYVEYITVTNPTTVAFVFRQPPLSYVSNIFLLPFRWSVWSTIGLLVVTSCGLLYLVAGNDEKNADLHRCEHCKNRFDTNIPAKWGDVCMVALGAVAQQGTARELRSISGRITIVLLFITLMFLYTSYSANIVALLQSQSGSIKTLADLLNSRIVMGSEDTVYNRHYFPIYNDTTRRAIWMQRISNKGEKPNFIPLEKGIERLRQGLFAFHMEVGVGYYLVWDTFHEDEKCGLEEIRFLDDASPWYSIQKNSSFRDMFKIGLGRLKETGILAREAMQMYTKKPICSSKGGGRFVSVGLVEIKPALVWLSSGAAIAICVLLLERLVGMKRSTQ